MFLTSHVSIWASQQSGVWPPSSLFLAGEQGFWFDASDITTLFQDNAGTTPVTQIGDPVGRWLDKSGRGNHATQSVSANRPRWGRWPQSAVQAGRVRNLLVNTATLSTQNVTVTNTAHTLQFKGTGTVTLSGASTAGPLVGTGANDTVTLTFTPSAGTLTLTVSGTVEIASLETGSTANTPQIVGAAREWDVTEEGQPVKYFLYFDGVNDSLATDAFAMTATDEASAFAGLTRVTADGVAGSVLSAASSTTNGRIGIFTPTGNASNSVNTAFRGTTTQSLAIADTFPQFSSGVVAARAKIATPSIIQRVNGVQTGTNTGSMGTGNFGNIARFIGSEGGSSAFYTGNIYQLCLVNKFTSATDTIKTEEFIAQRVKGSL